MRCVWYPGSNVVRAANKSIVAIPTYGVEVAVIAVGGVFGGEITRFGRRNTSRRFPSQCLYVADTYVDAFVLPKNLMFSIAPGSRGVPHPATDLPQETVQDVDEYIIENLKKWYEKLEQLSAYASHTRPPPHDDRWQSYRKELVKNLESLREPHHGKLFSKHSR